MKRAGTFGSTLGRTVSVATAQRHALPSARNALSHSHHLVRYLCASQRSSQASNESPRTPRNSNAYLRFTPRPHRPSADVEATPTWTSQEDTRLREAVWQYGANDWLRIAQVLGRDRPNDCRQRFQSLVFQPERLRRTWTKADNDKLLEAVKRLGEDNWPAVEKLFPEFSPGSVYAHYNALTRTTRNPIWKPFETARLRKAIDQYGGPNCMDQWINIARAVGRGRTAEDCYSQWYRRPFDPYPNAWGPPQLDVALLLIIYDASPRLLIRAPVLLDLCQAFREAYPVSYYSSTEDVAYIQCWQLHVGESGSLADMTAEGEVEVAAKEVNVKDKPDIRIWHQVALKRHAEWTKMAGTSSPNASTLAVEKKPEFSPLSPPPSFIHPSHIRNRFMRLMMGSNLAARFTPANLDLFRAGWMTPEKVSPAMAKQVMGVEATEFELRSLAWYLRCIGRFLPMIEDAQHGAYSNSLAVVSTLHRPALVA